MSLSTLGMVNYRTANQRTANYARQTRNAARAQVAQGAVDLELQRQQIAAMDYANLQQEMRPIAIPQGWYPAPGIPSAQRWWDGFQWTHHTNPPGLG